VSARKAASIELREVTKAWGSTVAVDRVSCTIAAGTFCTLLGPSGCGKTTTLRMIAGLETPTSGQVLVGGADVTRRPAWERDVGMVFQSYALFPHMSVLENVAYGLRSERRPAAEAHERAREALATVGLGSLESRLPVELSGGQQQRVALARALVLEPAVLLFDEPLSNLDARLRREMREEIRALQQRLAVTVVYVTHDQAEALAVSDRIVIMDSARIAGEGSPRALYEQPPTEFVARFMGEANIVPAKAVGGGSVEIEGQRWPAAGFDAEGPVRCALRPESLAIAGEGPGIAGTVVTAAYVGAAWEYRVETSLGRLFVVAPGGSAPAVPGTKVKLRLAAPAIILAG
jgi:iron(III) transport system ATP-binding protein